MTPEHSATQHVDLICLSHLRWGFVFPAAQHLMSRFAGAQRVYFVEEPNSRNSQARLRIAVCSKTGVSVVTPRLPEEQRGKDNRSLCADCSTI